MAEPEEIRALARPILQAAGLELWDVELAGDTVRIFVERDGGVDLDALSVASTALSTLLDDHDELVPGDAYHLEVSSPGLERTLRTEQHFERYVGATLNVKTTVAVAGGRRHRGVLTAIGPDGVTLMPDAAPQQPIDLPYALIERARTVLDWGPAPKPGRGAGAPVARPTAGTDDAPATTGARDSTVPAATGTRDSTAPAATGARESKDRVR